MRAPQRGGGLPTRQPRVLSEGRQGGGAAERQGTDPADRESSRQHGREAAAAEERRKQREGIVRYVASLRRAACRPSRLYPET